MQDMRFIEKAKIKEVVLVLEKNHNLLTTLRNIWHRIWYLQALHDVGKLRIITDDFEYIDDIL